MFLSSVPVVECSRIYDLVRARGVLPRELENDLANANNLSSRDLLSIYIYIYIYITEYIYIYIYIYMYAGLIKKERRETTTKQRQRREIRIKRKVLIEAESLREKVKFGGKAR